MSQLICCSNRLQFITALSILDDLLTKEGKIETDLLLVLHRRGMERIANRIKQIEVFRNIYTAASINLPSVKHLLQFEQKDRINRILGSFRLTHDIGVDRYFRAQCQLPLKDYDRVFVCNKSDLYEWVLKNTSLQRKAYQFEDGIGSYLLGESDLDQRIDSFYLFEPGISKISGLKKAKIPKLSNNRTRLTEWLKEVFSFPKTNIPQTLFIDQHWGDKVFKSSHPSDEEQRMWRRRIELIDQTFEKESGNLGILIHPASCKQEIDYLIGRYGKNRIIDLNGIPFEVYLLIEKPDIKRFYSIASSAAIYWRIACETDDFIKNAKVIFLLNEFGFVSKGLGKTIEVINKIKDKYPDLF